MKKTLAIMAVVAVAGVAVADIAATFTTTAPLKVGGSFLAPGNVSLMVWSATDTSGALVDTTGLAAGEIALWTGAGANAGVVTGGAYTTPQIFDFAGINTGYVFVRLFQDDVIDNNDWYITAGLKGPALTDYDSNDPGTIYSTSWNTVPADMETGMQVIPEPATIGLMGVAGLGMFLARRKARR